MKQQLLILLGIIYFFTGCFLKEGEKRNVYFPAYIDVNKNCKNNCKQTSYIQTAQGIDILSVKKISRYSSLKVEFSISPNKLGEDSLVIKPGTYQIKCTNGITLDNIIIKDNQHYFIDFLEKSDEYYHYWIINEKTKRVVSLGSRSMKAKKNKKVKKVTK